MAALVFWGGKTDVLAAQSGMGNYAAAEAHLKGLFTLIDIKTPENWQHRLYGLLQRVIAV